MHADLLWFSARDLNQSSFKSLKKILENENEGHFNYRNH